jgi:hypothetical protein
MGAQQFALIERLHFYGRIRRFIARYCRNPGLRDWASEPSRVHALWDPLWPQVRDRSEHDCALLLVFRAVCVCESVLIAPGAALPASLDDYEVRIKKFISERGYFRFSDFDFPLLDPAAVPGDPIGG